MMRFMTKEEEDSKGDVVSKRKRNNEISVLKKETKSLCRILGEMQQELY
jgi:hypothetical protein